MKQSCEAFSQADATEFSALLLDWLQRELSASWTSQKVVCFNSFTVVVLFLFGSYSKSPPWLSRVHYSMLSMLS